RLRSRAAIVAAGPLANLMLAVLLYALVNWWGVQEPDPVLARPAAGSIAERAGLTGGEWISRMSTGESDGMEVRSFEDLRWQLTQAALNGEDAVLWVGRPEQGVPRQVRLPMSGLDVREADAALYQRIG